MSHVPRGPFTPFPGCASRGTGQVAPSMTEERIVIHRRAGATIRPAGAFGRPSNPSPPNRSVPRPDRRTARTSATAARNRVAPDPSRVTRAATAPGGAPR
ncbi:hypothetical protein GCM10027160_46280 [Streptomyces calidiresistens]